MENGQQSQAGLAAGIKPRLRQLSVRLSVRKRGTIKLCSASQLPPYGTGRYGRHRRRCALICPNLYQMALYRLRRDNEFLRSFRVELEKSFTTGNTRDVPQLLQQCSAETGATTSPP